MNLKLFLLFLISLFSFAGQVSTQQASADAVTAITAGKDTLTDEDLLKSGVKINELSILTFPDTFIPDNGKQRISISPTGMIMPGSNAEMVDYRASSGSYKIFVAEDGEYTLDIKPTSTPEGLELQKYTIRINNELIRQNPPFKVKLQAGDFGNQLDVGASIMFSNNVAEGLNRFEYEISVER